MTTSEQTLIQLRSGVGLAPVMMRLIALDWQVTPVTDPWGHYVGDGHLVEAIEGAGVYAFEGRQDAHPERGILYIGQSQGKGEKPSTPALKLRVVQSVEKFVADKPERRLFADCHDVVLRWAKIAGEAVAIDEVESLLIRAHCPAFNAQEVRGYYAGRHDLIVMNAGAKGRLLPVVAAAYHAKAPWVEFG